VYGTNCGFGIRGGGTEGRSVFLSDVYGWAGVSGSNTAGLRGNI
jgi:hypothetical protein